MKLKSLISTILFFYLLGLSHQGMATSSQCEATFKALFTDGVATHDSDGKIQFEKQSVVYLYRYGRLYYNDGVIDFLDIDDKSEGTSCGYRYCQSSGSVTPTFTLGDFQDSDGDNVEVNSTVNLPAGDYKDIKVKQYKRVNFTTEGGVYRIKKLEIERGALASFRGGLYYIDDLTIKDEAQVLHAGGDTAVIYADNNVNIEKDVLFNRYDYADRFFMYAKKDVHFKEGSQSRLYLYSEKKVQVEKDTFVKGAINAEDIHLKEGATIYYDPDRRAHIEGCNIDDPSDPDEPLPDPVAHWPLDLCPVNGNSIDVVDIIGQNNGSTVDGAESQDIARYCQGVNIDGEGGHINIPHDDAFELQEGAVSFWFNTSDAGHEDSSGQGGQGLFSKDSSGGDSGGHLTIWIYDNNDRRIRVRHQIPDSRDLFSTTRISNNTWYHITYTWGSAGMKLYVNGVLEDSRSDVYGIENNPEPIILGSNAWVTGNGQSSPNDLRDHFIGLMDDVRLYDTQLAQNQIDELFTLNAYSCTTCPDPEPDPDPVLIGHWKNNLCTITGAEGEVVDAINGNNGQALDGTSISNEGKFCQSLRFNGEDANVNIPHANEFDLDNGTLSFWFKADDLDHRSDSGQGGQGLFSKDSSGWNAGGHHLTIWLQDDGEIRARHQTTNSSQDVNLYASSGSVTENQWYHLVYTWGSYGLKMYLNGSLVDSDSDNRGISGNPEPIILGANAWTTEDYGSSSQNLKDKFLGEMDDLRIYEGQLDAQEVSELYVEENPDACDECQQPEPVLVGHWKNNLCSLTGTTDEVVDSAGENHGFAVDGAGIDTNGKYCQALSFDGEDAHVNIPHSNDFSLANGSVSFWFKAEDLSHSNDYGQGGQGLFSKDSSGWNAGGDHLTIWLQSNGSIRVRHQTTNSSQDENVYASSGSIEEGEWYHLVYTWGNQGMNLFIDGVNVDSDSSTRGIVGNPEPIILGANAWVTEDYGSSSQYLKDKFLGEIDDVRLYDGQLTTADVVRLRDLENPDTCGECEVPEPEIVAHYSSDVCSINGDGGSYVDIINGYNGNFIDGVELGPGKFCNGVSFAGINEHINIPHRSDFEIEAGAISLWVRVPELDYSNIDDSIHDGQAIFSKDSQGTDNGGKHLTLWIRPDGDVRVRHQTTGENDIESNNQPIDENSWHHIAYTWGANGKRLYVDGQLVDDDDSPSQGIETNPEPIILGANASTTGNGVSEPDDLDNWFKGSIDDVRIYGTAQPDDDFVEALFEEDFACTECNTSLAHYKFEGSTSVVFNDSNGTYNGSGVDTDPNDGVALTFPYGDGTSGIGSCQAVTVPYNDKHNEINAIDTTINPGSDIGDKGTISFWYQADEDWFTNSNQQNRTLFDASSNAQNRFTLKMNKKGKLSFVFDGYEDDDRDRVTVSTSNINQYLAGDWVYITLSWDLEAGEVTLWTKTTAGYSNSWSDDDFGDEYTLGNLNSLYIGDNRNTFSIDKVNKRSADGTFDDVRVYRKVLSENEILADMAAVTPCPIAVNKYHMIFDSPVSICSAPTVTVQACEDANCNSLASGNQYVDIQYVLGNITYPVKQNLQLTNGSVTFDDWQRFNVETGQLRISSASPMSANGYTCSQSNCEISFDYTLEIVYNDGGGETNQIGTQIAETAFSNTTNIVSVKSPDSCPALEEPVALEVAVECINPSVCSANRVFEVGVGNTVVSLSPTDAGSPLVYGTVSNSFNGVEMQLSNLKYNDAGEIKLHVRAAQATASSQFVVKPAYLELSDTAADTTVAGEAFNMNVTAKGSEDGVLPGYQSGDLQFAFERYVPDAVSNNRANLVIDISSSDEDPINILDSATITEFGNNGFTDSQPQFTNGISENFVTTIDEVGQFGIDVRDNDFMGTGTVPGFNVYSGNTGLANYVFTRFIPAYFAVNTTFDYSAYCSTFSYRGLRMSSYNNGDEPGAIDLTPHIIELTAKNASNATTTYYDADIDNAFYYETSGRYSARAYVYDESDPIGENLSISINTNAVNFVQGEVSDGTFSFEMPDDDITFTKSVSGPLLPISTGSESGNFNISFSLDANSLKDMDGVGVKSTYSDSGYSGITVDAVMSGIEIREGRMRLVNAVNPEDKVNVVLLAEYYEAAEEGSASGSWKTNTSDSCTDYDAVNLRTLNLTNSTLSVASGSPTGAGTLNAGASGEGNSAMTLTVIFTDSENPTGQVQLGYDIPDDLGFFEYKWCETTNYDSLEGVELSCQNPAAEYSFGLARGNDRIIHWREVFR